MAERTDLTTEPVKTYQGTEAAGTQQQLPQRCRRTTWTTGLFDCTAHGWAPCFDGVLCFDCMAAEMYNKLYHNRTNQIHWPVCACLFVSDFFSGLKGGAPFTFVSTIFIFTIRRDLRRRYHIHMDDDDEEGGDDSGSSFHREVLPVCGEFGSDMLLSLFCWPCLLCQMQREMAVRGDYAGHIMLSSEVQQNLSAVAHPPAHEIA